MNHRFAALVGAVLLTVSVVGLASADSVGPSGSNLNLAWPTCQISDCTDVALEVDVLKKGGPQACLSLNDGTNNEFACTSIVGAITYSGRFIVGIGPTTITVPNFGVMTVSATSSITDGPTAFTGCSVPDAWRGEYVSLAGTMTVNFDSAAATGASNYHTTRTVKKC